MRPDQDSYIIRIFKDIRARVAPLTYGEQVAYLTPWLKDHVGLSKTDGDRLNGLFLPLQKRVYAYILTSLNTRNSPQKRLQASHRPAIPPRQLPEWLVGRGDHKNSPR